MKVLIIGANGSIGKIITPIIQQKHEVITSARTSGAIKTDISSMTSIENLFSQIGSLDAVICVAGESVSSSLMTMDENAYSIGIQQKLLSQINLVLMGIPFVNDNGSFTLISGKMGEKPSKESSGKSVANGAVNSFVLSAALEMPRNIRLNVISPAKVASLDTNDLINAYLRSIESNCNGEIIRIGY